MVEPGAYFGVADVADNRRHREAGHDGAQLGRALDMHQKFHVPAEIADAPSHLDERVKRAERHAAAVDQIDADATHTGRMHAGELGIGHLLGHCRHRAQPAWVRRCSIQHCRIVDAMHARLHYHPARDPERIVQRQQPRHRIVGRRVAAIGLIGEA